MDKTGEADFNSKQGLGPKNAVSYISHNAN